MSAWQSILVLLFFLVAGEFLTICLLQYVMRKRVESGDRGGGWQFLHFMGCIFMLWLAIMMSFAIVRVIVIRDAETPIQAITTCVVNAARQNPGEGRCQPVQSQESPPATDAPAPR